MKLQYKSDLSERLFHFGVRVIKYLRTISSNEETRIIKHQLIKSATSSGANYEEAQAGLSKADFINKVTIALKEMRESNYWLKIIKELMVSSDNKLDELISESEELKKILGSIASKSKKA